MRPVSPRIRVASTVVFIVMTVLGSYLTRAVIASRQFLLAGDTALTNGRTDEAILHYRHALEWYTPIGGGSEPALQKLLLIGKKHLEQNEPKRALFALRSARFGILSIRHAATPFASELPNIHRQIANAEARLSTESRAHPPGGTEAQLNRFREREPSKWRGLLGAICFALWLAMLFLTVRKGFDPGGHPNKRLPCLGGIALLFFVIWCLLIRNA